MTRHPPAVRRRAAAMALGLVGVNAVAGSAGAVPPDRADLRVPPGASGPRGDPPKAMPRAAPATIVPPAWRPAAVLPDPPGYDAAASVRAGAFRTDGLHATAVPPESRPWARERVAVVDDGSHDAAGVRTFVVAGRAYDHPVGQAQYGLQNLATFRATGDVRFLTRARAQADRLRHTGVAVRGALFHPYRFDFTLHRHGIGMRAPWYSGMAQGEALALFSQLADVPDVPAAARSQYRVAADAVFRSFLVPPARGSAPAAWVSSVDDAGYLWFQEYPQQPPQRSDHTFNGHGFATLGLWEYHRLTGSPLAGRLFLGGAATLLRYAATIRRPGGVSSYCATHDVPKESYHQVDIRLLDQFHVLTGNERFARMADAFSRDFPWPKQSGTVRFLPGRHTFYRFAADGDVRAARTVVRRGVSTAPADRRVRIPGQGAFYRLAAGPLSRWYVRESPSRVVLTGAHLHQPAPEHRRVTVPAGWYAVTAARDDDTGQRAVRLGSVTTMTASARAVVDGAEALRVATGPLADSWLPLPAVPLRRPAAPGRALVRLTREGPALLWRPSATRVGTLRYAVQVRVPGPVGWRTVQVVAGTAAPLPGRLAPGRSQVVRIVAVIAPGLRTAGSAGRVRIP